MGLTPNEASYQDMGPLLQGLVPLPGMMEGAGEMLGVQEGC